MCFNVEGVNISGLLIGALSAVIISRAVLTKQKPQGYSNPVILLMFLFYALHAVGFLYSQNKVEAGFNLEKKLSLAIFPILFLFAPKLETTDIKKILYGFVTGCTIVSLFCLSLAFKNYISSNDVSFFYYHSLSVNAGMHAGYLAMYLCFSIAILLYTNFRKVSELPLSVRAIYIFVLFLMATCIFLLSARTQLIILMLELVVYCVFFFNVHGNVFRTSLISVAIIASLLGVALLFPGTRDRIKEAVNYNNEYGLSKKWGEKQMRLLIWKSAWEAATAKPVFGTGTGDVIDDLEEIYKKRDFISLMYFKDTRFNAHNQYLETWIGIGTIGLMTLFSVLVFAVRRAVRDKNTILLALSLIFAISCLTESMLERQNGVIFFSLYTMVLLVSGSKEKA